MLSLNLNLACPPEFPQEIKNMSLTPLVKSEENKENKENKKIITLSIFSQEMFAKLNESPKNYLVELLQDNLRKSIKTIKTDGRGNTYYVFIEFLKSDFAENGENGVLFRTIESYDFQTSVNIKEKISSIISNSVERITRNNSSENVRGKIILNINNFIKIVNMGDLL
jgi:t-SNARE complex subunit (syntaxin)